MNTSPPCSHVYKILEIRVSQNPAKLGGVHKMSGIEGGEHWSKLCGLGGRVSTLALIVVNRLLVGVNFNPVLLYYKGFSGI